RHAPAGAWAPEHTLPRPRESAQRRKNDRRTVARNAARAAPAPPENQCNSHHEPPDARFHDEAPAKLVSRLIEEFDRSIEDRGLRLRLIREVEALLRRPARIVGLLHCVLELFEIHLRGLEAVFAAQAAEDSGMLLAKFDSLPSAFDRGVGAHRFRSRSQCPRDAKHFDRGPHPFPLRYGYPPAVATASHVPPAMKPGLDGVHRP